MSDEEIDAMDEYKLAKELDYFLYSCKIEQQFSNYRNYYMELLKGKITKAQYDELTRP